MSSSLDLLRAFSICLLAVAASCSTRPGPSEADRVERLPDTPDMSAARSFLSKGIWHTGCFTPGSRDTTDIREMFEEPRDNPRAVIEE